MSITTEPGPRVETGIQLPPDHHPSLAPTARGERLVNLDFVRGVALLGILMVNVGVMFGPLVAIMDPTYIDRLGAGDRAASLVVRVVFMAKFISIFSMLFGYGLYNQMQRAAAKGRSPAGFTFRRLAVLAAFGLIHATLVWYGDVLFVYSMLGAWLLLGRHARARTLAVIGLSLMALALVVLGGLATLGAIAGSGAGAQAPAMDAGLPETAPNSIRAIFQAGFNPASPVWLSAETKAYSEGPWIDAQVFRLFEWMYTLLASLILMGGLILGMFFMGAALWRARFFDPDQRELRWRVCRVCLPLGLAFEAGAAYFFLAYPATHLWANTAGQLIHQAGLFFLPLGYLSGLALLADRLLEWLRSPVASAGRMSLTVYLAESLIMTGLAYHWGFGLFGSVGPLAQLGLAVVVWSALVAFSHLWQSRFALGPMEWLWRRLEYGRARTHEPRRV